MRAPRFTIAFLALVLYCCIMAMSALAAGALKCEIGPAAKNFGNVPWLVYGCDDGRSVVVVSAPGNPAMPFYFMFYPEKEGYRLVGEGSGRKEASSAAFAELSRLSAADVMELRVAADRGKTGAAR